MRKLNAIGFSWLLRDGHNGQMCRERDGREWERERRARVRERRVLSLSFPGEREKRRNDIEREHERTRYIKRASGRATTDCHHPPRTHTQHWTQDLTHLLTCLPRSAASTHTVALEMLGEEVLVEEVVLKHQVVLLVLQRQHWRD